MQFKIDLKAKRMKTFRLELKKVLINEQKWKMRKTD